jgi:hypothetical protein
VINFGALLIVYPGQAVGNTANSEKLVQILVKYREAEERKYGSDEYVIVRLCNCRSNNIAKLDPLGPLNTSLIVAAHSLQCRVRFIFPQLFGPEHYVDL